MRTYLLLFLLFAFSGASFGQERINKLRKANNLFDEESYVEAQEIYELLMGSTSGQGVMGVDARINLAKSYNETGHVDKAVPLFEDLLPNADERPDILLAYGQSLLSLGKFDEARSQFLQYADQRPEDPAPAELLKRLDAIESIIPVYPDVQINYQAAVNDSLNDEFGPAFYGTGLVFSSDRIQAADISANWGEQERSFLNLYFAELSADGQLAAPAPFARKLNGSRRHDGPASFSRDGKLCFYNRSVKETPDAEAYTLQIFASELVDGDWSKPLVLEFVTQGYQFMHPSLSADGRVLFFVSDMPGGLGGTDIWMSRKMGDKWSKPQNLGEGVNSRSNEAFPFAHPNGTLYYASKGKAGYGGYDLFRSRPTGNGIDWTEAENLGQPLNSAFDDTYFLLDDDQTKGFFSSSRNGSDDLYQFILTGEEPQELPPGIAPRGKLNFTDSLADSGIDDEKLIDSLINAGFVVEETTAKEKVDSMDLAMLEDGGELDGNEGTGGQPTPNPNSSDNFDPEAVVDNGQIDGGWSDPNAPKDPVDPDDPDYNPWALPDEPSTDPNDENTTSNEDPYNYENTEGDPPMLETQEDVKVKLSVDLQVVQKSNQKGVGQATIVLTNLLDGREERFTSDANGKISLPLRPDQKYIIRAEAAGFYGGNLPVATMQAYEDQSIPAILPLIAK